LRDLEQLLCQDNSTIVAYSTYKSIVIYLALNRALSCRPYIDNSSSLEAYL